MSQELATLKEYFDGIAEKRDKWRKRNRSYHRRVAEFYRFHIPEGRKVLEIGCGTGFLLDAVKPEVGIGIDFSEKMLEQARELYPDCKFVCADAHDYQIDDKMDFIIISDTVGYFTDIQRVFENIRRNCKPSTRIIVTNYNFLWDPILRMAANLKLKMREPFNNWLNLNDLSNLLHLADFDVVKSGRKILMPKYIPLLSRFCNKVLANLPLLNHLCLMNFMVARPLGIEPCEELVTSVVIPARNEAGNIENAITRMPRFGKDVEIIFIEGGSSDNTWEEIQRVAKKYSGEWNIKSGRQEGKGKGDACRKGYDMATGDILMILDADLTVPPEDLPKFYEAIASNKGEFINGTRLVYPMEKEAMRTLNLMGNKLFSMGFTWLLDQKFKDTLCGTKVLTKDNYEALKANRSYFGDFDPFGDFDLIFGASKMDLKIVEIPVRYKRRVYGDTNISRFSHGWLLIKMWMFALFKIKFI